MQTIWIPRLSAAAIMLGLGAAVVTGSAVAAAAPADSDAGTAAPSASSSPAKQTPQAVGNAKAAPPTPRTASAETVHKRRTAETKAATADASFRQDSTSKTASVPATAPKAKLAHAPEKVFTRTVATNPTPMDKAAPAATLEPTTDRVGIIPQVLTRPTAVTPPHATTAVVSQLMSAIGVNPAADHAPAVPLAPQSWTAALDAVRRWLSQTLISQLPVASPRSISQSASGEITGTLDALDPAGNPLTYTVTEQPKDGTVTVDPDGTFHYTPNATTVASGGLDDFTVSVSNGVRSLFVSDGTGVRLNLWQESSTSVPVNLILRPDNALGTVANVNRFWVINTSSKRLRWNGYLENDGATGPYPDVYIDPGQEVYFDLPSSIGTRKSFVTTFSVDGDYTSPAAYGIYATQSGLGVQDGSCWGGSCSVQDGWAFVLNDAPNTNITINALTDPYGARDKLLSLCQDGSRATCDFTPTRQEKVSAAQFELTVLDNGGTTTITQEVSETRTASQTDSVEISAEASSKLSDLINVKINAKYGHSWTKSETFSYKLTVPVAPGTRVRVLA
ncbi:MAG: Ig-like domain-containing protein, partial [Mycobacterium sp.]